jgi:hypothetical protein
MLFKDASVPIKDISLEILSSPENRFVDNDDCKE